MICGENVWGVPSPITQLPYMTDSGKTVNNYLKSNETVQLKIPVTIQQRSLFFVGWR